MDESEVILQKPMEFVVRVTDKGRIYIPKEIREYLGISDGDFVRLQIVGIKKVKERKE